MRDDFQLRFKEEQEKSKFLLDIINAIPEPIMAKDRHGKFIFANKALANFYNTEPHQMIGKDDSYFTGDIEQTKAFTESVQAIINGKTPKGVYEDATDTNTGVTHSFYSLKTPFINHKGEDNVVIIATDITDIITLKNQAEKNEKMLTSVLDISSEGMWEWNTKTNDVFHNKTWEIITGVVNLENSFEEFQHCIFEKDTEKVNDAIQKLLEENIPYDIEYRMVRPSDGKKIWIWDRGVVLENNDQGEPLWVVGIIQDITERKNAEEKLTLAASVFIHARESIVITDAAGTILDVNDTFANTTGYSREEVIGKNPRILQSGRQPSEFYVDMWQALLNEGYWSGEIWNRRKNGEVYAEIKTVSAVHNEYGITTHYVALGNDITQLKEHQYQLERVANFDALTNLPNRSLLADRLSQSIVQCHRSEQLLAVLFLDLDGFKAVNDFHGHNVGDELLIALSVRMQEALREGDTLARIGGDEFVAVLTGLTKVEDCEPILERLLLAASEPITVSDVVLNISASIGVTLYPKDNVDADLLMRHADQAMYVAKALGKNQYHLFDTAQDDAVKVQRESLEAIRGALDNHQFVLYYQPKVNMKTGRVIGVEALIRWQHPERGLLNPIDFLPVIENNPMMIELGEWVIDSALTQISQWQAMGVNLPLCTSVNIDAIQLQQPNFSEKLAALLAAHPDVKPEYLELEVLETSALDDIHDVSTIMNECITLGVKFALDDFGTGYSSLTYLRRLPANLIKIDQTFVRDMLIDADDFAIVEGVIALAKSFKRDVIAEGVETVKHGKALLKVGCELAQGYGIARPMPASDIPSWVQGWKPDVSWQVTE
jgi:diguanylate cyclase (GGDEF)-like protein/PAS domain S-box-containing protein